MLPWLFVIISGVSSHSSWPNPINTVIFSCSYRYIDNFNFSFINPKPVVLNLFCLIYPLTKSKNGFYPQQCLVRQGMIFQERVRGRFSWENVVNVVQMYWLRYMNFCAYWNQFQSNACKKLINLGDETLIKCCCKQAWLPLKKWFAEVIEILKTTSYEPAYHWIKGQTFGRRNTQPYIIFSFFKK